ncbi:MAG: Holliday junction branch migration protein RuvA [Oscillospiraceae bacterium]|nr:Holliday junction branch migration protein RuvA [Oscillospiraceae bacterium]
MYYYIKGILAAKGENYIVVDASGVGYMIYTPLSDIEKAPQEGREITVYTYLNVREDAMELYGFITEEEKEMFLMLISVSGVGPKAGLAILSIASPKQIAAAIITGDTKTLTKAQGVGPKAAKRILLELKDKIDETDLGIDGDEGVVLDTPVSTPLMDSKAEAMSALVVLGYSANEAKNVLTKLDDSLSTEELIRKALAQLM